MVPKKPKYFGTNKGDILVAIAIYGAYTFYDIEDIIIMTTELNSHELRIALEELVRDGEVYTNEDGEYRVREPLSQEYSDFEFYMGDPGILQDELDITKYDTRHTTLLADKFIEFHKLDISLEKEHFYLESHYLDTFIKYVISQAEHTVIIVNPFFDFSTPTQLLVEAVRKGKRVVLVTRPPTQDNKVIYEKLIKSNISVLYHKDLHAKIVIVDDSLAIISSMNLTKRATAGITWEAGIVTIDQWTVDKIKESIANLNLGSVKI